MKVESLDLKKRVDMGWKIRKNKEQFCGSCKDFIEPNECRDRAIVYPQSPACQFYRKKRSLDWLLGNLD
jgi:hypothetical protein